MTSVRVAFLSILLGGIALAGSEIVDAVRSASEARNFALADREIQKYRSTAGVTPEMLEALSWLARGTLDAAQYDRADDETNSDQTQNRDTLLDYAKRSLP